MIVITFRLLLVNVKGLKDRSSPVDPFLLLDGGSFAVDLVPVRPGMNCNAVPGVIHSLCSLRRFSKVLPVSPIYTQGQSMHGIL